MAHPRAPQDLGDTLAAIEAHLAGRTPQYRCEHRLRHKDGDYRWILSRGIAQRDAQGAPYRMVGIHTDITEHYGVEFALTRTLPDVRVDVDAARLGQVMSNLLSNAAKFSHVGGRVEVEVARERGGVRIAVIDHGVGIPKEFRARIFQKFSQADSSDTRHQGGTGLGLGISRALVERMGGHIDFDSEVGVGTTFHILLPEHRDAAASPRPAADRPAQDPQAGLDKVGAA